MSDTALQEPYVAVDGVPYRRWQQMVADQLVDVRFARSAQPSFRGSLRVYPAMGARLGSVQMNRHDAQLAGAAVRHGKDDGYFVASQLRGQLTIDHGSRSVVVGPGDIALYSTREPIALRFSDDFTGVCLWVPAAMHDVSPELLNSATGNRLAHDHGLAQVFTGYFEHITRTFPGLTESARATAAEAAAGLVRSAIAEGGAELSLPRGSADALYAKVSEHIDAHLTDPGLSPASIAAAHFVSLRWLSDVFRRHGETVASEIRNRRLAEIRGLLVDSAHTGASVASLAHRYGWSPSYLGSVFKERFSETPAEYRNRMVARTG